MNKSSRSGISLVETLVAIAILGVISVTFMTALSAGSISVNNLQQETTAQALARTQMENIKAASYDSTGNSYAQIYTSGGYQIGIQTSSAIFNNDQIQKIRVEVLYERQLVSSLESFKVNR